MLWNLIVRTYTLVHKTQQLRGCFVKPKRSKHLAKNILLGCVNVLGRYDRPEHSLSMSIMCYDSEL